MHVHTHFTPYEHLKETDSTGVKIDKVSKGALLPTAYRLDGNCIPLTSATPELSGTTTM
jgi:hypothetical protein